MVTNRISLEYKYPSFTEEVVHTCLEIRKEKGYPIDENEIEHYYKKLQSIATNLSREMKITNASAKEVIKKYISNLLTVIAIICLMFWIIWKVKRKEQTALENVFFLQLSPRCWIQSYFLI